MSEQLDIPFDATNQIGRAKLPLSPDHSPTSAFSLQPSAFSPAPATDDQVRALKRVLAEASEALAATKCHALVWLNGQWVHTAPKFVTPETISHPQLPQ